MGSPAHESSYEKLLISTKAGENREMGASRLEFEKLWSFKREVRSRALMKGSGRFCEK